MTPTSATGRARILPRKGRVRMGFTLVEMMVTVAIIGMAATAVVLAAPDPTPSLPVEAERLAARLVRAREESLLTNRPVAVDVGEGGYGFRVRGEEGWAPLTDGPFERVAWEGGTRVAPDTTVLFDPVGLAEPAALTLARDGARATVTVDLSGEVHVGR